MTIIGSYQIGAELGKGGMGVVYQGIDLRTQNPVAIKSLLPDRVSADLIARFVHEGDMLGRLNHPNIVKMLDMVQEDERYFIVMELVEGGSLADRLTLQAPLPLEQLLLIALELSDALSRAHHLNIIHRDLKPANILLAGDGTPRLTDFGIARTKDSAMTATGQILGTLAYLAPEILQGATADVRSDIWAFGIILWEMLAGKRPFTTELPSALITEILFKPLPDLETLCPTAPSALIDLIYRMLAKNPAERLPSVRIVGTELEALWRGIDGTLVSPELPTLAIGRFATSTPDLPKHNLPLQMTPFIGREDELAELDRLLDDPAVRLITVQAPGGMGKTRLALEVAARQLATTLFGDGVFFIELAPLREASQIPMAIVETLHLPVQPGEDPSQQVLNFLHKKTLLLVVDNFEHVLTGADFISEILQTAPSIKVLATSREKLNRRGETIFNLAGIDFPDWETPEDALEYAAVKLFMQSARRVQPQFELLAPDLKYVARICRLAGGMPLAIELAAAWVEILSLEEIAEEMQQNLDFLATEQSDVPERQRSIRAVCDYAWYRLTESEQAVFRRLAIFRGGATRQAIQTITRATLRDLQGLVNKALIQREPATGRYQVHELLRQYAEDRLMQSDEVDATLKAYLDYFTTYLQARHVDIQGRRQMAATEEIKVEVNNLRQVWQLALEHRDASRLATIADTWALYIGIASDWTEGMSMLRQAVDTLEPETVAWDTIASLYEFLGIVSNTLDPHYHFSEQIGQRAQQRNDRKLLLYSLVAQGTAALFVGDPTAFASLQSAITLATELEEPYYRVRMGSMMLGLGLVFAGQPEAGYEQLKIAFDEVVRVGDLNALPIIVAEGWMNCAMALNRHQEAFIYVERAMQVIQSPFDKTIIGWAKSYYEAYLAFLGGDFDKIQRCYTELRSADFGGLWHWEAKIEMLGMFPVTLSGDSTQLLTTLSRFEEFVQNYVYTLVWGYWLATLAACANANFIEARQFLSKMAHYEKMAGFIAPEHPALAALILALEAWQSDIPQRSVGLMRLAFEHTPNSQGLYTHWAFLKMVRAELEVSLGGEAYYDAWERGKALNLKIAVQQILA